MRTSSRRRRRFCTPRLGDQPEVRRVPAVRLGPRAERSTGIRAGLATARTPAVRRRVAEPRRQGRAGVHAAVLRPHHPVPDQHPKVGTSGLLRGNHNKGKNGWSRRVHYEISGAGRIDYEYHPTYKTSDNGDERPVVRILVINLGSH